MHLDWNETSLVRPVFEQRPGLAAIGALGDVAVVIGAEPRKQRHVVGAHQHIDAVNLQQAELPDGGELTAAVRRGVTVVRESLRAYRKAARLRER